MAASKSPQLRLLHIRDEIDGVTAAVRGGRLRRIPRKFYAAERAVQIISEAAKALPSELTARYPHAPWSAIIGIGNVLRHDIRESTIEGCGTSLRCICRNCARSSSA